MSGRRLIVFVVAALLLVTAGCGGSGGSDDGASGSPGSLVPAYDEATGSGGGDSDPAAAGTAEANGGSGDDPGAPPAAAAGSPDEEHTTTTKATLPPGQFKVTVTMGEECVNPGGPQTVKIQARPGAVVTWVTEYSDGDSHHNNNGGIADSKGSYTDSYVVDIAAPDGEATVTATVSTKDKGVAFGRALFAVGGC